MAVPLTILALGFSGIFLACSAIRRGTTAPIDVFLLCGTMALATVLAIHFSFAFQRHLETGWLKGIHPPLLLALACCFGQQLVPDRSTILAI
ncbi:MAG: hypothetical protein HC871_08375 [Rhizobiales bacterium]|nr:hypothetical protein [Hyphomicrobiales bacterium]